MKLVRFSVNNFRCIEGGLDSNHISFEDMHTVFIFGQNNVGKSSFLKAYQYYYDNTTPEGSDFTFLAEEGEVKDIEMEIWLRVDGQADADYINEISRNKFDSLSKFLDEGVLKLRRIWTRGKKTSARNLTFNPSTNEWEEKSYGGIGLDNVFQTLLPKPLFIHAMPSEEEVKSVVNEVLKEVANAHLTKEENLALEQAQAKIKELQDKIYDRDTINEYENEVNEKFALLFSSYKIKIDEGVSKVKYTHDKLGKDFEIDFKHIENDQSTNYSRMGHGAVRMAIFLLMLMRDRLQGKGTARKDYLVLFEEPELFLHPRLTKKLRQLVYDVSASDMPFQILCASHSPQMIDLTKDHTSIARMIKRGSETNIYQVTREDLKNDQQTSVEAVKQKIYELLRFNPFVCESFYADEVVLVEGDTEAIVWRGYLQKFESTKDIFVVNCGSGNNIPFYQKVFSQFKLPYSVICDTDHILDKDEEGTNRSGWDGKSEDPTFTGRIQKSIADQYAVDKEVGIARKFFVCPPTFEPLHSKLEEPFKYEKKRGGKAVSANSYWEKIVPKADDAGFGTVPIISYIQAILK